MEKIIYLLRYLNTIIYEKEGVFFPPKMITNLNPKRLNTRVLVFKIKTEKIFVTLNLLPTIF